MKKVLFIAIAAVVAFASCNNEVPKGDPKTELDTLSYQIGVANSMGIKDQLSAMGVDSAYMDEFIKGVAAAAKAGDDKKLQAYYAGIQVGQYLGQQVYPEVNSGLFGSDSTQTVNLEQLIAGFVDGANGQALFSEEVLRNELNKRADSYREKTLEKTYGEYKKQGQDFMAKKAKEAGIQKLPGGTLYKVITEGNGPVPALGNKVMVKYEGKLAVSGEVFDSSDAYRNGQPTEIIPSQVIPAWQEALKVMPEGSTWELYVPYDQAYGVNEIGQIKPFSTLVFTITLVKAKSDATAPQTPANFQIQ